MKLYLVRHGLTDRQGDDPALSAKGKSRLARAAEGLRKIKVSPELTLTSPARRARETADVIANALGAGHVEVLSELAPGSDPTSVLAALRPYSSMKELVLVGHQPALGRLASMLLAGSVDSVEVDFKRGAVICLEGDLPAGQKRCKLAWFATARMLRAM